ncbi:membrane protein insertion efficiency factor YidD [Mycolicibacterium mageritense]|uniref:membrane protein insertion efficiency factor YidD n=1 Tax=Mycolicibacterium mageritense TaxID=53462 RepID=UPI0023F30A55|nr:membrane protein insertion efficiency factor YidD [Mycolicibacterium mageritense]MBN3457565.1 membrane protein insertion efficiency factor YidD [Mycobacterium sp. DSM 3803]
MTTPIIRRLGARAARGVIFLIQLYRHTISPLRLPTCRFAPTCSQYAVDALTEYGLLYGGWLATVRLLKCGPWHRGGWDPIPVRRDHAQPADAVSDGRNESYV